jgi:hypothetical protein
VNRVRPEAPGKALLSLASIKGSLVRLLDPSATIAIRVQATITRPAVAGLTRAASSADPLRPILAAPDFPQPMYEVLRDLSQELLLPGLGHVPPNTVTLLETNAKFVESFMVGLNTEMGRELLWRGFPTDQRGTYFRQFWDGVPWEFDPVNRPGVEEPYDIDLIDRWGARPLGKNLRQPPGDGNLVLLIRGELMGRYPNAVIYAAKAIIDGEGKRVPGPTEEYPIFRGTFQPDLTFLGFKLTAAEAAKNNGWFFIIQEQPTEPRFGFDVGVSFGATTHVSALAPPPAGHALPPGAVWGRNSAHMAHATRQLPVRIAIHATQMIP